MTMKQCNSCQYKFYHKRLGERCWLLSHFFMNSKNCSFYRQGTFTEYKKTLTSLKERNPKHWSELK